MATKRTTKKAETMAAKKAAKTVAEVKATAAAEVKAEPSKAEAVKAATESVKETAKEAVKETAKAPAKTAGKAEAKKPAVRRTAKKAAVAAEEIFIQYAGKEFTTKDVVANVKKAWTEMTGKKEEDIQDIKVYVKTEENKAYYVVNGEAEGHYVEL
ncbi:DUF6465 family protein [Blautia glucerasea]|jgi:septal ring-binding cell division protein DamX|uniref:DUF6465 family protein n=1 Tax=Blautia glucerasea TaxID=536633 RepID=UPI001D010B22|nr:DUF6465 family protein [Blautia glucerasea]MCB5381997.1 DUF6465 family protein [Blautia glucerasea]